MITMVWYGMAPRIGVFQAMTVGLDAPNKTSLLFLSMLVLCVCRCVTLFFFFCLFWEVRNETKSVWCKQADFVGRVCRVHPAARLIVSAL